MDVVLGHELEVCDTLLLKPVRLDLVGTDLSAKYLCADIVLSGQGQLHLVQDEIYFLFGFQ